VSVGYVHNNEVYNNVTVLFAAFIAIRRDVFAQEKCYTAILNSWNFLDRTQLAKDAV
jgi:hypothetical protein